MCANNSRVLLEYRLVWLRLGMSVESAKERGTWVDHIGPRGMGADRNVINERSSV